MFSAFSVRVPARSSDTTRTGQAAPCSHPARRHCCCEHPTLAPLLGSGDGWAASWAPLPTGRLLGRQSWLLVLADAHRGAARRVTPPDAPAWRTQPAALQAPLVPSPLCPPAHLSAQLQGQGHVNDDLLLGGALLALQCVCGRGGGEGAWVPAPARLPEPTALPCPALPPRAPVHDLAARETMCMGSRQLRSHLQTAATDAGRHHTRCSSGSSSCVCRRAARDVPPPGCSLPAPPGMRQPGAP
jgi:hypothetical protein